MSITTTIKAGESGKTIPLNEGRSMTIKGSAGAAGMAYLLDKELGGTNSKQSWVIGSGSLPAIGPFDTSQRILIVCAAGSIGASVGDAVAGLANITPGVVLKKSYRSDLATSFHDGSPRGIAQGASVGALLVECSTNFTAAAGSPTLSTVSGLNQTGAGAGTPVGVTMDLANGLVGTPVSKTGLPKMLQCVTTGATASIGWRCCLANGSGITSAGSAAAIQGGNFGLWAWIGRLPGQDVGGVPAGQIQCVPTMANNSTGGAIIGFNNNQLKEGWNFLKFQDTRGKLSNGAQPLGIAAASLDDAQSPFLVANAGAVRNITVNISGFPIGTTIIFDSFWTGVKSRAAFVLGCDNPGDDLVSFALPKMQQYGFKGYLALPRSSQNVSYPANVTRASVVADWKYTPSAAFAASAAGWLIINHTLTHPNSPFPNTNQIVAPEDIRYEVMAWPAWARGIGLPTEGMEFYAASQGASSRLSELVIRQAGVKLQRVYSQQNVQRTPWGLSNPHSVGSFDLADQTYQGSFGKIKATIDVLCDYGDVGLPFWHIITSAGDDGTGAASGDGLKTNLSTFNMTIDYLAARVFANDCDILSMPELYYGN